MPARTVLHISLPDDTIQRIKQIAQDEKRSQSYVARDLIEAQLVLRQYSPEMPKVEDR